MKKIIVLILALAVVAVGFFWGMPMYKLHFSTIDLKEDKTIFIETGTTMDELAAQIESEGILKKEVFSKFSTDLEFDDSKIEAGKYQITGGMKIKNLIYGLKNGNQEVKDVKITFNNCDDIYELAGKVAPSIEADSTEIATYISDPKTMEKYGFRSETMM